MSCKYRSQEHGFHYEHLILDPPNMADFKLHNHNDFHELLIFLEGDAEFRVEGTVYFMRPHDIVITNNTEMHMMCHQSKHRYERIVIGIQNNFFVKNHCEEFKTIFTGRPLGVANLIGAEAVENNGLLEIVERMERYIGEGQRAGNDVAVKSALLEFLYNLNKISRKLKNTRHQHDQIKDLILYLNENITGDLTLEAIADHFFMNKYYLCHVFKEQTGFTVNKYITYKRILLVRELVSAGKTLTEASIEAGFGNYSNFYKMYKKETGMSPREGLVSD